MGGRLGARGPSRLAVARPPAKPGGQKQAVKHTAQVMKGVALEKGDVVYHSWELKANFALVGVQLYVRDAPAPPRPGLSAALSPSSYCDWHASGALQSCSGGTRPVPFRKKKRSLQLQSEAHFSWSLMHLRL